MRLGFLDRAGPPDESIWLRKIRSWEKSILFSPKHLNGKIIGAERVRSFIGYGGWPITLQLPLDTLASLCKLIADWLSGSVVVCASFTCEFLTSYAVEDCACRASLRLPKEKKYEIKVCSKCFGLICQGMLPLFFTIAYIA